MDSSSLPCPSPPPHHLLASSLPVSFPVPQASRARSLEVRKACPHLSISRLSPSHYLSVAGGAVQGSSCLMCFGVGGGGRGSWGSNGGVQLFVRVEGGGVRKSGGGGGDGARRRRRRLGLKSLMRMRMRLWREWMGIWGAGGVGGGGARRRWVWCRRGSGRRGGGWLGGWSGGFRGTREGLGWTIVAVDALGVRKEGWE